MFDVAPTELLLVMVVALVIIGPKDLPKAMRFVGKWMGKARAMARHFRSGLDTMMREAELEELEKQWRKQNDEIMRQFPNADANAYDAPSGPEAPQADASSAPHGGVDDGQNPDFTAATTPRDKPESAKPAIAKSPTAQEAEAEPKPETHIVPPRGGELP